MSVVRTDHTATLLRDGRVLVAGGFDVNGDPPNAYSSAELYDPGSGTFSPTGSLWVPRAGHTATLLPNGEVLLAGSTDAGGIGSKAGIMAEIYDPIAGAFSPTEGMDGPYDTATALADGSVLLTGGSLAGGNGAQPIGTAELYRP